MQALVKTDMIYDPVLYWDVTYIISFLTWLVEFIVVPRFFLWPGCRQIWQKNISKLLSQTTTHIFCPHESTSSLALIITEIL